MKQFAWASFDSYASSALAIISIAVVGRILSPDEIGVFSTAAVFVGIATVLRDFGVSNYLIQSKECSQHRIDTAYAISQGIAALIALALMLSAYPLSQFYAEKRLLPALIGLAFNLLLIARTSITLALLRREMRFDQVVSISFTMTLIQNGAVIALALLGVGYMSMVYAAILSNIAGLLLALRKPYSAKLRFKRTYFKEILSFGFFSSSTSILRDMRSYLNELVLAKTQGMASVAYQSKALSIMTLFWRSVMPGIYSFSLSLFAKGIRDGSDIKTLFLQVNEKVAGIALPALAFLAVEGDTLVLLLNGPNWGLSAEIGRLVPALYLPAFPLLGLVGTLMIAGGKIRELSIIQLAVLPFKLIVVFYLMNAELKIFVLGNVFLEIFVETLLFAYFLNKLFGITTHTLYLGNIRSFTIAALFAGAAITLRILLQDSITNPILRLTIESPVLLTTLIILLYVLKHPLRGDIVNVFTHLKSLKP